MNYSVIIRKQPKVFASLGEGFKALAGHLYLLLFPIGLDLYFLFAPRFTVRSSLNLGAINKSISRGNQPGDCVG